MNEPLFYIIISAAGIGYLAIAAYLKLWPFNQQQKFIDTFAYPKKLYQSKFFGHNVMRERQAPIPADVIDNTCSAAVRHAFSNVRKHKPHWTKGDAGSISFMFVKPAGLGSNGEPVIHVKDRLTGQSIASAGTISGYFIERPNDEFPDRPRCIVLPDQHDQNWSRLDYLYWSAYNEAEHVIEFLNDTSVFMSFAVAGDIHPHFPIIDDGNAGLNGGRFAG